MSDLHWGDGVAVGSVIASRGDVTPAAGEADIGCGVIAQKLSLRKVDLPSDLNGIRKAIKRTSWPTSRTW